MLTEWFKKYPMKFNDLTAIKVMHKTIERAQEKCKKKDESYLKELALVYAQLEDYFEEKGINPETLL